MPVKAQRRGRYAGLAILLVVGAGLAVAWLLRQPSLDDAQPGASAPVLADAAKLPTAAAEPAGSASAEDGPTGEQPPADCLAALATPEASSRLLREQRQRAIERLLEQQGDERKQALIADLAGYPPPGSEALYGLTANAWHRYQPPMAPSERELSGEERQQLRVLLKDEGIEALVASVDAAVLQATWTPGTSFMAYLIAEHGEALHATLPAVASAMPLSMHEVAAAIASGVRPADFALLLEAAEVDPAATWWNGANLAKLAAIHARPQILRLLTARGVEVASRPPWGYGTILDDIAAKAKPEDAGSTEALADVVGQLAAAGVQPELPSTLRTLAEWLPDMPLPPLHPEAAALANSLGEVVAAVAAMDADWTRKIDAASRLEQHCEAQLADFEGSAAAFHGTDLAAKQRYQEVLLKRRERTLVGWAEQSAADAKPPAEDAKPASEAPGDQALRDPFLLALQDDRWRDAMAIADQIGGYAHWLLLDSALNSAPLDIILELVQRQGSLPDDAILSLGMFRHRDEAAIARALEPFGLDPHYVNEVGENAFTRLAEFFLDQENEWQLAEYLASRSVAVKPHPFGLDTLDRVLMRLVAFPTVHSDGGVRFARFLIDHGAPVETSHLQLAGQLLATDEEAYRRLVNVVPELASRVPGG